MFKHQGDISFTKLSQRPTGGKVIAHNGSFILARGEHTGHKHVIATDEPDSMTIERFSDGLAITITKPTTVTHEQHGAIMLTPGTWQVGNEREIDWFAEGIERKVID